MKKIVPSLIITVLCFLGLMLFQSKMPLVFMIGVSVLLGLMNFLLWPYVEKLIILLVNKFVNKEE